MEWGTVVGTLTAVATLLTAIGGLLVTVRVLIPNHRVNESTHKIVNQQRTDMLRWQATLVKTLESHGIDVPEDQSKIDTDEQGSRS